MGFAWGSLLQWPTVFKLEGQVFKLEGEIYLVMLMHMQVMQQSLLHSIRKHKLHKYCTK